MNKAFEGLGFYPAEILLPRQDLDLSKWAVVACDQFTSQPEYWEAVEQTVGKAPSALRLILPEAHLADGNLDEEIADINRSMQRYLTEGIFRAYPEAMVYVERTQSDGSVRKGLVGMIDLLAYDFTPGSGALIRATEGTVLSRIPPRVRVRKDAPVELPHVMVLIDDEARQVIEPAAAAQNGEPLYDFVLQQGGGRIRGRLLPREEQTRIAEALRRLSDPAVQARKYGLKDAAPLVFAVGDGNHSLATAKRCYEDLRETLPEEAWLAHPARYALVELVNLHDEALQFEPIHRVVFGAEPEALLTALAKAFPDSYRGTGEGHCITVVSGQERFALTIPHPEKQLAVGTLQAFLDDYITAHPAVTVDYIHDEEAVLQLAQKPGSIGFLLPAMGKNQLFKTVMADGVLPRKTFSMGHARDKRYYLEARRIR